MAFKSATVNSSLVAATLTDFPSYVDLSRVGVTTLAEAQSVRIYADAGKVVEWAREVVSASEGHVKIPSLTTTTVIYADYDGVRADYAVTDTYGRNAVWSGYVAVWHLNENVNNNVAGYVDSTANGNNGTGTSMAESPVAGKIGGQAASFDGVNDYINVPDSTSLDAPNTNNKVSYSAWIKSDSVAQGTFYGFGKATDQYSMIFDFAANTYEFWANSAGARFNIGTSADVTNWLYVAASFDPATDTGLANFNGTSTSNTRTGDLPAANANPYIIAGVLSGSTFSQAFDGKIDELRVRSDAVSANWITTEYNNQSNESSFWGTWTDVGGGTDYDLDADFQTFVLTGTATGLYHNRKVAAPVANFALTGRDATFTRQLSLRAETGSFGITANDAPVLKHSVISAEPATYTLTGYATFFPTASTLGASTGVFSLTPNDAQLLRHYVMPCAPATFALTGNDAVTAYNRALEAEVADFELAINDAQFLRSLAILGAPATYQLTGSDAGLAKRFAIAAEPSAYALSSSPTLLTRGYSMVAGTEAFVLSGVSVAFIVGAPPIKDPFSPGASQMSRRSGIFSPRDPIGQRAPRP